MKEQLSAWIDGELDPAEIQHLSGQLKTDPELSDAWHSYHLIGDALRQPNHLAVSVADRVAAQLAHEPTLFAPAALPPRAAPAAGRLKLFALAASTAFVGALGGYQWLHGASQPAEAVQASAVPEAAAPVLAALEDNAYLLAHHDETNPALGKATHTSEGVR